MQRYEFFSKSQPPCGETVVTAVMLFTMQRYDFFSKSQQDLIDKYNAARCYLPCKGTNFLANHNDQWYRNNEYKDVIYHAKVRIF